MERMKARMGVAAGMALLWRGSREIGVCVFGSKRLRVEQKGVLRVVDKNVWLFGSSDVDAGDAGDASDADDG